uniref:SFRICE_033964 n=1 Tax=Spodoptera frugiperda TaxID=7108 RepID=A0A2H1W1U4_SPOFR
MSTSRMERPGRRAKAGSLSGLSGGLPSAPSGPGGVRRQRSLEWGGDRYSSSDDDRPPQPPPLADRVFASLLAQATQQFDNRGAKGLRILKEQPRAG